LDLTYQRIQQPHPGLEVAHLDWVEEEANRYTDEDDRVVHKHRFARDLMEVQIHEQTEKEKTPTRKLRKLPPVEVVAGIVLEDENVVDLGFVPHTTRQAEEEKEKVDKKVAAVDLRVISLVSRKMCVTHLQQITGVIQKRSGIDY
jgi:3D (Asp-Asp-Asp) domain-containing protein